MSDEESSIPKPPVPGVPKPPVPPPSQRIIETPPAKPAASTVTEDDECEVPKGAVPFQSRVIALVIDGVLASGLTIAVNMLLPSPLGLLVGAAYIVTRDSLPFLSGQSIGKAVMKYKAVTVDGERSLSGDWKTGAIRNAPLVIPLFAAIECAILLTREDKPDHGIRLGDEWAKTKVVSTAPIVTEDEEEDS